MRKCDELSDPNSCLNKAKDDEIIFVLRSKDPSSPDAIREWAKSRLRRGINVFGDAKIEEALRCAELMQEQRIANGK